MKQLDDYIQAYYFQTIAERNNPRVIPKEGDLFKVITAYGKSFELRYGYYDEQDRHSKYNEPIEIYPDFLEHPEYTDEGIPFATAMQDRCKHFKLKDKNNDEGEDNVCFHCIHYEKCDELLGVCRCKARRKNEQYHNKKNAKGYPFGIDAQHQYQTNSYCSAKGGMKNEQEKI